MDTATPKRDSSPKRIPVVRRITLKLIDHGLLTKLGWRFDVSSDPDHPSYRRENFEVLIFSLEDPVIGCAYYPNTDANVSDCDSLILSKTRATQEAFNQFIKDHCNRK